MQSLTPQTDHNVLLQRLEELLGLTGIAIKRLKSCLFDQYQFVHMDNKKSQLYPIALVLPITPWFAHLRQV